MYNFEANGEFLSNGVWQSYTLKGSAKGYEAARKMAEKMKRKYVTRKTFTKIVLAGLGV